MSELALESGRRDVYSPSRLNREARAHLEKGFSVLWVSGEVSNLARPASGHLYFSLKDAQAQVRCACFRNRARYLRFEPRDGEAVLIRARVSLYEARGEFQLIADHMEPAGAGALQREFERLKAELDKAGLFALEHKQALPRFPRRIGIISSGSGAALHDVLNVLGRRFAAVAVRLYPVPVQGVEAAPAIAHALALAAKRRDCEVLILTRGGGSLEDLWAFNEALVARALFDCPIPVICAVGHEVDVTIADLVADLRAPTPSAAAELAVPDGAALSQQFVQYRARLRQLILRLVREHAQSVDRLEARFQRLRPDLRLQQDLDRLAGLKRRLTTSLKQEFGTRRSALHAIRGRLQGIRPLYRLRRQRERTTDLRTRLALVTRHRVAQNADRLHNLHRALQAVSPQATLNRGYAIVQLSDGRLVRRAREAPEGSQIQARLAHGRLLASVYQSDDD